MYSRAFRQYVRRVERAALAGKLDAIRTLGAIAIALATLTMPGHADSMLGINPVKPPLGIVSGSPTSGEKWTIRTLLGVNGRFVASARYGNETYPTGEKCQAAVIDDAQLKSVVASATRAAADRYGPTANVIVLCSMAIE